MNSYRIKEIQETTAYPESTSVMLALKQVWNECAQEQVKNLTIPVVTQQSELLNNFFEYLDNLTPAEYDSNSLTGHGNDWLKII